MLASKIEFHVFQTRAKLACSCPQKSKLEHNLFAKQIGATMPEPGGVLFGKILVSRQTLSISATPVELAHLAACLLTRRRRQRMPVKEPPLRRLQVSYASWT